MAVCCQHFYRGMLCNPQFHIVILKKIIKLKNKIGLGIQVYLNSQILDICTRFIILCLHYRYKSNRIIRAYRQLNTCYNSALLKSKPEHIASTCLIMLTYLSQVSGWIFRRSFLRALESCIIPLWERRAAAGWRCSWSTQGLCGCGAAHSPYIEKETPQDQRKTLLSLLTPPLASLPEVGYVLGKGSAVCARWRAA